MLSTTKSLAFQCLCCPLYFILHCVFNRSTDKHSLIAGVYSGQKLFWAARRQRNEQKADFANVSLGYQLNRQQIQIQYHISCHYATLLTNSVSLGR